jgi:hypothetical protein
MPTAAEYHTAMLRFRSLVDRVDVEAAVLGAWWREPCVGPGPARAPIDAALLAAQRDLSAAADTLAQLVATCGRRAVLGPAALPLTRVEW